VPLPPIDPDLPLSGLRVLDFSTTIAGPSAVRHLADFGAQVIKIESRVHPDGSRSATPFAAGIKGLNRSGYFAAYNAGKLSMALNMQVPAARDILRRLVEKSDVLVEAFVPGVVARWGFSYEQVSSWNPRIIMASHCLQGQTGPHASQRGYGHIASALSGWYDLTGPAGEQPLGPYSAYTDFIAWSYLLNAILVALEVRDLTGRGQYIDHAQLESSIQFLTPLLLDLQVNDHLATRRGNREDYAAPNNAYRCRGDDRWIALSVATDAEWATLCRMLGHPEAGTDPRFATMEARQRHEEQLDRLVSDWTADQEPFELAQRLQTAGISAGVVQRAQDLFADPQLQHRRFFRRLDHPELGNHAVHGHSFLISGIEPGPSRAAPLLGEHTLEVCRELLDLSETEIADYAAKAVFE
jgi:benzylsuccinate CoA-transferase BbsF subunit